MIAPKRTRGVGFTAYYVGISINNAIFISLVAVPCFGFAAIGFGWIFTLWDDLDKPIFSSEPALFMR